MTAGEDAFVLFQPDAGVVYADRACAAFARGLRIEENHRVESLDDLDEDVVVVCAGPWARRLLAPHGIDLPVVETRETVAYFRLEGEVPSVVAEVVTKGHGFYSLADPVYGLKVGCHMRGKPADPDVAEDADPALVAEIAEWTAKRFPAADPDPVGAQSCFYTTTDDERFILERHGRIVVGSACSGHGFKFAPAVGSSGSAALVGRSALGLHEASPPCRCTSASATSRASGTSSSATTGRSSPRRSWASRASPGTSRSSTTSTRPAA